MAIMNIISTLSVVVLVAIVIALPSSSSAGSSLFGSDCGNNKSHNFYFGNKGIFDRILYSDDVEKDSSFMRKITVDPVYPSVYQKPQGFITYMEVLDLLNDGSGGCAWLMSGGIGQDNVKFHLKSQRSGPIKFKINIYGLDNVCVNKRSVNVN